MTASFGEILLVGAVVLAAGAYLASRAARLLRPRGRAVGCGAAGSRCCPAVAAAGDLREAARRASRRFPGPPAG